MERKYLYVLVAIMIFTSCKKFVQINPPPTSITGDYVFNTDGTALAAINGLYSKMLESPSGSFCSYKISLLTGLSSDEYYDMSFDPSRTEFATNSLLKTNFEVESLWNEAYSFIYQCNSIIGGVDISENVTPSLRGRIKAEAKFVRAYIYFYLLQLFGDVPYVSVVDYLTNKSLSRDLSSSVYENIINDLIDAGNLLPDNFQGSNGERIVPTKWAAFALLARVFLFKKDYNNALSYSTAIISESSTFALSPDLNSVFLANNQEAVWQLKPVVPGYNTWEGFNFIPVSFPSNVVLSKELLASFENGDLRKAMWTDSIEVNGTIYYYPFKYKLSLSNNLDEYSTLLRLSEQYLIKAEAELKLDDLQAALLDLNAIRTRAGLSELITNDSETIDNAILNERRIELFSEWGHRWFDLIREGKAGEVLSAIKGSNWQPEDTRYPIPQHEIDNDPYLSQNPGY